MRKLGKPGDRLREYRDYLGMTLEDIEAWSGVKGSTWSYAETEGKSVSSKILEALRKAEPPAGKRRLNFDWLSDGSGEMLTPSLEQIRDVGRGLGVLEPKTGGIFRWMAEKATAGVLVEWGLDKRATAEQREFLTNHLAHSAAMGAGPQELEKELQLFLDMIRAAPGRKESK